MVIVIDKDKSMKHQPGSDTDMDKLGPRLEQIFKTRAERVVFVKGDPDLEFETVAQRHRHRQRRRHRQDRSDDAEDRGWKVGVISRNMKSTLLVAGIGLLILFGDGLRQTEVARCPESRGPGL